MKRVVFLTCLASLAVALSGCGDTEIKEVPVKDGGYTEPASGLTVSGIAPQAALPRETITVRGDGFGTDIGAVKVLFGDTEAVVSGVDPATIICVVPKIAAGEYTVTIGAGGGQVVFDGGKFTIIAPGEPEFTSLTPSDGPIGTPVTIDAINVDVDAEVKVFFGDTEAQVSAVSSGGISVTVPDVAWGGHDVKVVVDGKEYSLTGKRFEVVPRYVMTTVAGAFNERNAVDGSMSDARFSTNMQGVGVLNSGHVFVYDNSKKVRHMDFNTGMVSSVATDEDGFKASGFANTSDFGRSYFASEWTGEIYELNAGTTDTATKITEHVMGETIRRIWSICLADNDNVLYMINGDAKIWSLDLAGDKIPTLFSDGGGISPQSGDWSLAMAYSRAGDCFYVASQNEHCIYRLSADGSSAEVFAGIKGSAGRNDGSRLAARFDKPQGMAVDANGNIYVADNNNCAIRRIDAATGNVSTVAGQPADGQKEGVVNGDQSVSKLSYPSNIAIDADGNFYICEYWGTVVRKMTLTK